MALNRRLQKKILPLHLPTQQQLEMTLRLPVYDTRTIRQFLKRVDGMEEVASKTARALEASAAKIVVPAVTPETIRQHLAETLDLLPIEEALFPYYRRAYENRLAADAKIMASLFTVWRIIRAGRDRQLKERFAFLGDWIARHRGRKPKPNTPLPAPPTNGVR